MSRTSTTSARTAGQETKYRRLVEDSAERGVKLALSKVEVDSAGWQRVLENGDDLRTAIAEIIVAKTRELSVPGQFTSEEVASSYSYPAGYTVKGITEQMNKLRELFPGIGYADEKLAQQPFPNGAEGWFAIPKWQMMAATYNEAVAKVLAMLAASRRFCNYREGQLGPEYLRQHARTAWMFQKLGDEQKDHDILVVPAQFGLRHRGRSVRRAREVFMANEFGLGAFAIGIMLLTHPEREVQWKQLHVDCAGDEYAPYADGEFVNAPVFNFNDDRLRFCTRRMDDPRANCGSASGFLPQ